QKVKVTQPDHRLFGKIGTVWRMLIRDSSAWVTMDEDIPEDMCRFTKPDALVSPTFKQRDGETPKTYLALKVAETIGGPILGFSAFQTEQGNILEDEA